MLSQVYLGPSQAFLGLMGPRMPVTQLIFLILPNKPFQAVEPGRPGRAGATAGPGGPEDRATTGPGGPEDRATTGPGGAGAGSAGRCRRTGS